MKYIIVSVPEVGGKKKEYTYKDKYRQRYAGYNAALTDLIEKYGRKINKEDVAKILWQVCADAATLSGFVKPWKETKSEVKAFYYAQAQAIISELFSPSYLRYDKLSRELKRKHCSRNCYWKHKEK